MCESRVEHSDWGAGIFMVCKVCMPRRIVCVCRSVCTFVLLWISNWLRPVNTYGWVSESVCSTAAASYLHRCDVCLSACVFLYVCLCACVCVWYLEEESSQFFTLEEQKRQSAIVRDPLPVRYAKLSFSLCVCVCAHTQALTDAHLHTRAHTNTQNSWQARFALYFTPLPPSIF